MKNAKHLFLGLLTAVSLGSQVRADRSCSPCGPCGPVTGLTGCNNPCSDSCSTSCSDSCSTSCSKGSRTGFAVRPLSTDSTLELALYDYYVYHNGSESPEEKDCVTFDAQVNYFHRSSSNRNRGSGLWPNGTNSITVAEDGSGDIESLWLGLGSTTGDFQSVLSVSPCYKVNGAYIGGRFNLDSWACGLYASMFFAVARVENNFRICENVTTPSDACPGVTNVTDVISNLTNGQFCPSNTRCGRTHVDDIQLKFGYDYFVCDDSHIGLYLVGTVPTRRKFLEGCDGDNFFDGRLGGRHGSIGLGFNGDWTMWSCEDQALNWLADVKYLRASSSCEKRVLDLTNGPLSRFLLVVTPTTTLNPVPALPYLNRDVKVKGRSILDFWTALHWQMCDMGVEIGYDAFWRQRERLCIRGDISTSNIGIFDIAGCGTAVTASTATINSTPNGGINPAVSDATFTNITNADLDPSSGAHGRVFSQKVYGALSCNANLCSACPAMLGFGAEYEFARRCDPTLRHWGIFIKGALSF